MKIIVLGNKGMAGSYIYTYLKNKFITSATIEVVGVNRSDFDREEVNLYRISHPSELEYYFNVELPLDERDVLINCIGAIKPRVDELGIYNAIKVNSVFPHMLNEIAKKNKAHLIHITTDCVFSGYVGNYYEGNLHDAMDIYGKTKSLGEPEDCTIIRTSIIGEEKRDTSRSFLQWVINQRGKQVDGYTNHKWNGITCLRLAQIINDIIIEHNYWKGVKHIFSDTVTKYQLIHIINDTYKLNLKVIPTESSFCDRTLNTCREDIYFPVYDIKLDIIDQKEFEL